VRLEDGTELEAPRVFSSAGWVETLRLVGGELAEAHGEEEAGQLSFVETASVLDVPPAELGFDATTAFFNLAPRTVYDVPPGAIDVRSGVVCCPQNYRDQDPEPEGLLRVTVLASPDVWRGLPGERYRDLKEEAWERTLRAITAFAPDVRRRTVFKDVFTPRTIERYTGHVNGAVYGAPVKRRSGETPVPGLVLCGTDQGYLGIVGALFSGLAMANRHALVPA
jgi:phytoene dehydrogenase-like protein